MSQQTATTDSGGGGWFSRIFRGGASSSEEQTSSASPQLSPSIQKKVENAKKLIRYSSPTSNGSPGGSFGQDRLIRLQQSVISPTGNYKTPLDKRKRLHLENGGAAPVEDIFSPAQRTPKRFCGTANLSLVEEPIRITVPERLDITWAGDRLADASPASSSRSLRSRISGQASTASSSLSSKTRAILQQLERVHTPAREARKLPLLHGPAVTSERWNAATSQLMISPVAPPLKKLRSLAPQSAQPTRLQLLSTYGGLGQAAKPYWKDLNRPTMRERDEAAKGNLNGSGSSSTSYDLNGSRLHPIFEIPTGRPSPKKTPTEATRHHKVSVIKGTDGVSRNVFNTKGLDDDEERNPLPVPEAIPIRTTSLPQKGFLGDLSFTFELPKDRFASLNGKKDVNASFEQQESSDNESDTSETTNSGEQSDVSGESTRSSPIPEEPKQKTPEQKKTVEKVPEVVITGPKESKNEEKNSGCGFRAPSSTSGAATEKWDCQNCFIQSTGDKCLACGVPKGGSDSAAPPQKELVSNLSSFASAAPVKFGFGLSSGPATTEAKKPEDTQKEVAKPLFGGISFGVSKPAESSSPTKVGTFGMTPSSSSPNLFGKTAENGAGANSTAPAAPKISFGAAATAAPATASKNWSCSACFVDNPGDKEACVCCSTPKDGSSAAAAPKKELISNLSSFAPAAPVKFGFGVSSTTSAADSTTSSNEKPVEKPTISFGMTSSSSSPSLVGQSKENGTPSVPLLFGKPASSTTGPIANSSTVEAPKISFGASPVVSETSKPLFGSTSLFVATKPLFGATTAAPLSGSSEAPKPLFGGSSEPVKPLFAPTEATKPLFGAPAAKEALKPLFGSAEAPKLSFGPCFPEAPKLTFGATSTTSDAPKPIFDPASAPGNIFCQPGTSTLSKASSTTAPFTFGQPPTLPAAPIFGSQPTSSASAFGSPPEAKKSFTGFGSATTESRPAPIIFGQPGSASSANLFGQSNQSAAPSSTSGFNFGAPPATFGATPASSLTTSASAGTLFNPSTDAPTSFNFGAIAAPGANQPFQFGSQPGQMPTLFGNSAPSQPGGSFAYSASSTSTAAARKIATARRRIAGRR